MAFRNIPPNGFPAIPDIEDLEGVEKDVNTLKTTTAGLAEDVSDLEEQKANQITIALPFNPETTYEVGDLVYYNGLSYRCTNEHTGEWDADDFAGTTIANELSELKSGLINTWGEGTVTNQGISSAERKTWTRYGNVVVVDLTFTIGSSDISGDTTELFSGFPAAFANTRFRCQLGYGASQIDLNLAITNEGKIVNQWSIDGIKAGKVYSCSFVYVAAPSN